MRSWYINGRHYAQTCGDWLKQQDYNSIVGIAELEKDAEVQGLGEGHGMKIFYRLALGSSVGTVQLN